MTKKSSGAAATEKVAALVAPAGEQRRCAHHWKQVTKFPLNEAALTDFNTPKKKIEKATLRSMDENLPFTVECDASDVAVSATLNQRGRPVACMSRSFQGGELHYPAVEKEATAIIQCVNGAIFFPARISLR